MWETHREIVAFVSGLPGRWVVAFELAAEVGADEGMGVQGGRIGRRSLPYK